MDWNHQYQCGFILYTNDLAVENTSFYIDGCSNKHLTVYMILSWWSTAPFWREVRLSANHFFPPMVWEMWSIVLTAWWPDMSSLDLFLWRKLKRLIYETFHESSTELQLLLGNSRYVWNSPKSSPICLLSLWDGY